MPSSTLLLPRAWGVLALALVGLLLSACGKKTEPPVVAGTPAEDAKRPLFFICTDHIRTPMRSHQLMLLDRFIHSRAGVDVAVFDAKGDNAGQVQQIEDAISQGTDYLMVFPGDVELLIPTLKSVLQKGVKVFAFSDLVPADACTTRISCDERALGKMAGRYIIAALKTKAASESSPQTIGRVVLLRGEEHPGEPDLQVAGFLEALSTEPGIDLVHDAPAHWDDKEASARMAEAFQIQKTFDVVFAQNDLMALGASQMARSISPETRESLLILGIDGAPGKGAGMDLVNSGELDATVYNPPLVDVAWNLARQMLDDPAFAPKPEYVVKPFIIGPDNVAEMIRKVLPPPNLE